MAESIEVLNKQEAGLLKMATLQRVMQKGVRLRSKKESLGLSELARTLNNTGWSQVREVLAGQQCVTSRNPVTFKAYMDYALGCSELPEADLEILMCANELIQEAEGISDKKLGLTASLSDDTIKLVFQIHRAWTEVAPDSKIESYAGAFGDELKKTIEGILNWRMTECVVLEKAEFATRINARLTDKASLQRKVQEIEALRHARVIAWRESMQEPLKELGNPTYRELSEMMSVSTKISPTTVSSALGAQETFRTSDEMMVSIEAEINKLVAQKRSAREASSKASGARPTADKPHAAPPPPPPPVPAPRAEPQSPAPKEPVVQAPPASPAPPSEPLPSAPLRGGAMLMSTALATQRNAAEHLGALVAVGVPMQSFEKEGLARVALKLLQLAGADKAMLDRIQHGDGQVITNVKQLFSGSKG